MFLIGICISDSENPSCIDWISTCIVNNTTRFLIIGERSYRWGKGSLKCAREYWIEIWGIIICLHIFISKDIPIDIDKYRDKEI